jgi:hypothetical protein
VDALCDYCSEEWKVPDTLVVDYLRKETARNSGLRRFLVDWFSKAQHDRWMQHFEEKGGQYAPAFLNDLVINMHGLPNGTIQKHPWKKIEWQTCDKCVYHEHETKASEETGHADGDQGKD